MVEPVGRPTSSCEEQVPVVIATPVGTQASAEALGSVLVTESGRDRVKGKPKRVDLDPQKRTGAGWNWLHEQWATRVASH